MKNEKRCPKCNSTDIIKVPDNLCNKISNANTFPFVHAASIFSLDFWRYRYFHCA